MSKRSTRQDDEQLLAMMHLRCAGVDCAEIAAPFGLRPGYVRAATNRVKTADAECGEDIAGAYW